MSKPDARAVLAGLPKVIESSHGTGGAMTHELIERIFLPLFRNQTLEKLNDQAILDFPPSGRLAVSTDSFVVKPYVFKGGNIGDLAVNGTVNDLLMGGATPQYLTASFVLVEGLPMVQVWNVATAMAEAAKRADVEIVTGDTKVVEGDSTDGLFINTTGIGFVPPGVDWGPHRIAPGDRIIVSGTIGDHGASIMASRFAMDFESDIQSDTASLRNVVLSLRDLPGIRCMRDPTRGGVATTLVELAAASHQHLQVLEELIPIRDDVRGMCEILGLDPLYVANEGKLVTVVDAQIADTVIARMKRFPVSQDACVIGTVGSELPGRATLMTPLGARRIIELLPVEQLPRIC